MVFCDVYSALLDYFKALMTPYMSFLLQPFAELLTGFTKSVDDEDLWVAVVQTLTKSFTNDEAAFWRDDRLRQLTGPIVAQVSVCTSLDSPDARGALSECVIALTEVITDDMLVKNVNLELLMHTRHEEAKVRLYALTCAESLWRAHGAKLMGMSLFSGFMSANLLMGSCRLCRRDSDVCCRVRRGRQRQRRPGGSPAQRCDRERRRTNRCLICLTLFISTCFFIRSNVRPTCTVDV